MYTCNRLFFACFCNAFPIINVHMELIKECLTVVSKLKYSPKLSTAADVWLVGLGG